MIKDHRVYRPYKRKPGKRIFIFLLKIICLSFIFYMLVSHFLLTSFLVNSRSMEPTINQGERLFLSPLSYGASLPFSKTKRKGFKNPERGDIVVICPLTAEQKSLPFSLLGSFIDFLTLNKRKPFHTDYTVKRIIGLPGDYIRLQDFRAFIKTPESQTFEAEQVVIPDFNPVYNAADLPSDWQSEFPFSGNSAERQLGEDEYFVLGDNRLYSNDSRSWQEPVSFARITGKVLMRYFPLNKIGSPR